MPLTTDSLLERMKLKSQLKRWRLLAILVVVGCGVLLFKSPDTHIAGLDRLEKGYIARIAIQDVIFEDKDRNKILAEIQKNDAIKAVVVHINSPGGTVVGGEELYGNFLDIATKKPIVTVMGSVAASGGYMAALGTDYIIAHRGTVTGSIGVVLQTAEVTNLADKLGITLLTFKSGPFKAAPSPFEKLTPAANAVIQSSIEDTYNLFVDMVAERRKLPRPTVLALADGRVYTGGQALENQLVDALGGEKQALVWLHEQKKIPATLEVKDIELSKSKTVFDQFLSSFSFMGGKFFSPRASTGGFYALWSPGNS